LVLSRARRRPATAIEAAEGEEGEEGGEGRRRGNLEEDRGRGIKGKDAHA
jgi:hypothetical protein